jgi:dihydropyrimidinase
MPDVTLIRNGLVVEASGAFRADITYSDGVISQVAQRADPASCDRVIDAEGLLVIPGGIDPHTHFDWHEGDDRVEDDFTHAGRAAIAGGITSHIDFAFQRPGGTLKDAIEEWHGKARDAAVIDYGFHPTVVELNEGQLDEVPALVENGYSTFKVFMVGEGWSLDDRALAELIRACRDSGARVSVHAENGLVQLLADELVDQGKTGPEWFPISRPWPTETEATYRALSHARTLRAPLYVVHMTSGHAVAALAEAHSLGEPVHGETCIQYLVLTDEVYKSGDFDLVSQFICSPPIRSQAEQDALWAAIRAGTISVVGSDHAPFGLDNRRAGKDDFRRIPNGVGPIEHLRPLLWDRGVRTGKINPSEFVALTATNAARLFGLAPKKGSLAPGADADIVLWDPEKSVVVEHATLFSASDHSLFDGWEITGQPRMTISRGEVVYEDGVLRATPGRGRYLHRARVFSSPETPYIDEVSYV